MNFRKRFSGQFTIIGAFLIFVVATVATGFIFQNIKAVQYKKELTCLEKQLEKADREIERLQKIEKSDVNDELEDIARHRLNMVKPNETIYIVSE